jgi:hypothetical protein
LQPLASGQKPKFGFSSYFKSSDQRSLATTVATETKKIRVSMDFRDFFAHLQLHLQLANKGQLQPHLQLVQREICG